MKKYVLTALFLILANNAFAGCMEDFRYLQDKSKVSLKKMRDVEIKSLKDLKNLREAELKAAKNYISYLSFEFDGDNALYIKNEQYQTKDIHKSSVGYRISVTDGGDESTVRCYIKIDVGMEDVAYPILYRVWHNQSPERDFLCQTY